MPRVVTAALCALVLAHCSGERKPSRKQAERGPKLTWDSSVGWELDRPFPNGKTSRKRKPTEYLTLAYASLDDKRLATRLLLYGPLRNKSLIAEAQELCHPNLRSIIASAQPDRLLIRITGKLEPKHAACLAALPTPALYLGLCPDDTNSFWSCDGDRQLRVLAAAPELARRVRAIAVGFDDPQSWRLVARFPAIEYLTVRAKALEHIDSRVICELPALHSLDLFDATQAGNEPGLPLACILRLKHYAAATMPTFASEPSTACTLRQVVTWSINDRTRALFAGCPNVELIAADKPE